MCLAFIIPTLYLHVEYYLYNHKDKLKVVKDHFQYEHRNEEVSFKLDDIKQIISYKTPPLIEKRFHWLPWASYNFTELILKNGQTIILTCYLVNEPEFDNSTNADIQLKEVLFPNLGLGKREIRK